MLHLYQQMMMVNQCKDGICLSMLCLSHVMCSCGLIAAYIAVISVILIVFVIVLEDFLHWAWLQGHPRLSWTHIWSLCKKAGSELQWAQVSDDIYDHLDACDARLCLFLFFLQSVTGSHASYTSGAIECVTSVYRWSRVASEHQRAGWVLAPGWCHTGAG